MEIMSGQKTHRILVICFCCSLMVMLEIPRDCITKFMKSQVPVLEQKESDDIMIKAEEFDENEIKFDEDEIKMLRGK